MGCRGLYHVAARPAEHGGHHYGVCHGHGAEVHASLPAVECDCGDYAYQACFDVDSDGAVEVEVFVFGDDEGFVSDDSGDVERVTAAGAQPDEWHYCLP